jgi:hypothetical protein
MGVFDVSKNWVIVAPRFCRAASLDDLAKIIALLRQNAGQGEAAPSIGDAESDAALCEAALVINADAGSGKNGYAWRAAESRVEIYGHSPRSLDNAIFNFIAALGVDVSRDDAPLPRPKEGGRYPLLTRAAHAHHDARREIRLIPRGLSFLETRERVVWAAKNAVDEIILSLSPAYPLSRNQEIERLAASYHLDTARGGFELSLLVPRSLFFFHKDLFRMDGGKRQKAYNFCASNHKTQELIEESAARFFARYQGTKSYYLFADTVDGEEPWCSCPACRAFCFEEQKIMALRAAARALAAADSTARIYWRPLAQEKTTVVPAANMSAATIPATIP